MNMEGTNSIDVPVPMTPEIASSWIWCDLRPRWMPYSVSWIFEVVPACSHEACVEVLEDRKEDEASRITTEFLTVSDGRASVFSPAGVFRSIVGVT